MSKLPNQCPSCKERLVVAKLACPACDMQLEGRFELHELAMLSDEELAFVLAFVKASGSLKQLAKERGQSYPTIRNYLNDLISKLENVSQGADSKRNEILDAISKGELSVKDAAKLLKEVGA